MSTEPPASSWVSPVLVVGDSPIDGRGLFVTSSVEAGEQLVRFGGSLVGDAELRSLIDQAERTGGYVDTIGLAAGRHLVLDETIARFGNHSCAPTASMESLTTLVAKRALVPGYEVTVDYATLSTLPGWSMTGRCGADRCRGTIH